MKGGQILMLSLFCLQGLAGCTGEGLGSTKPPSSKTRALDRAVYHDRVDEVRQLLAEGADPDASADRREKVAPLHMAALSRFEILKLLLESDADPNVRDRFGNTPLHYSVENGDSDVCLDTTRLLIEAGADVHAVNRDGRTALHEAAWHDRMDQMRFLLEHGADVNARCYRGMTPLQYAAETYSKDALLLLLENGADPNTHDIAGWTPLHRVAAKHNSWIPDLVERGADVEAKEKRGYTPLHVAVDKGDWGSVKLLLMEGAKLNALTSAGDTPLSLARKLDPYEPPPLNTAKGYTPECKQRIIQMLIEAGGKMPEELTKEDVGDSKQ